GLLGAWGCAVVAAGVGIVAGCRNSALMTRLGRWGFYTAAALVLFSSLFLVIALATNDFSLAYVTEHSERSLPLALKLAAFYGGQEGSLLYWTAVLCVLGSISLAFGASINQQLAAWAQVVLAAIVGFFLFLLVFVENPFSRLLLVPQDGLGLNPVLRDGGMLIHPPFQLAGYSSFALPFAWTVAALLARGSGSRWIAQLRRLALISWGLQSAGLLLGMWWAYHVLGWGGYFGWDPVENVALMPWLAVTAALHVIPRSGSRLSRWSAGLIVLAFLLSVMGTFIVRSGILPSVHSFAISPLGPWLFCFLLICLLVSGWLLAARAPTRELNSPELLREPHFLPNLLILLLVGAILWGTLLPLLSGLLGAQLTVGASYYQRVAAPLLLAILALLALGPGWSRLLGRLIWRGKPSPYSPYILPTAGALLTLALLLLLGWTRPGVLLAISLAGAGLVSWIRETWRRKIRLAAGMAHIGLLVLAIGVIGSQLGQQQMSVVMRPGHTYQIAGYSLTYQGLSSQTEGDHQLVA
ncbi:MAG: cytochrome c biogenesis protein CcsA, partial [Candidatus Dormibacteraceae bacterium]